MVTSSPNFKCYPYVNHGYKKLEEGDLEGRTTYRFTSAKTRQKYIVYVEKFKHEVFVLKFFLQNHRLSEKKYNLLTNLREPRLVVNTCLKIMLDIHYNNQNCSFGFIGSPCVQEQKNETKRYRFYTKLVGSYIGENTFLHYAYKNSSAYLLLNVNAFNQCNSILSNIEAMVQRNHLE